MRSDLEPGNGAAKAGAVAPIEVGRAVGGRLARVLARPRRLGVAYGAGRAVVIARASGRACASKACRPLTARGQLARVGDALARRAEPRDARVMVAGGDENQGKQRGSHASSWGPICHVVNGGRSWR